MPVPGWAPRLGIVLNGLGFTFYVTGLRQVPASYPGAFLPLIPVFGVAAGYLVGNGSGRGSGSGQSSSWPRRRRSRPVIVRMGSA